MHYLKVPEESLARAFRNSQKLIEKEISVVLSQVNDIGTKDGKLSKVNRRSLSLFLKFLLLLKMKEETIKTIDNMVSKLNLLKKKLDESKRQEDVHLRRCKARLDHLGVCVPGKKYFYLFLIFCILFITDETQKPSFICRFFFNISMCTFFCSHVPRLNLKF